ncbi:hypothetical protein NDU88_006577 [Pleurodeles waltl]|uniref:Uncharacterized protein n=1 Tax=Pleurodeles waltl TaxID=8319 RepID=A0AAV7PIU5_PLEWA|nr:hypothetical protein NDU88_006577 [Pleurodeles waltl]
MVRTPGGLSECRQSPHCPRWEEPPTLNHDHNRNLGTARTGLGSREQGPGAKGRPKIKSRSRPEQESDEHSATAMPTPRHSATSFLPRLIPMPSTVKITKSVGLLFPHRSLS